MNCKCKSCSSDTEDLVNPVSGARVKREIVDILSHLISDSSGQMLKQLLRLRDREPSIISDVLLAWIDSGDPQKSFYACEKCGGVVETNDVRKRFCNVQENRSCFNKRRSRAQELFRNRNRNKGGR